MPLPCPWPVPLPPIPPQFALGLVVKESFKVYKAVSEGVINLADAFFEMEYHDAGGCTPLSSSFLVLRLPLQASSRVEVGWACGPRMACT